MTITNALAVMQANPKAVIEVDVNAGKAYFKVDMDVASNPVDADYFSADDFQAALTGGAIKNIGGYGGGPSGAQKQYALYKAS